MEPVTIVFISGLLLIVLVILSMPIAFAMGIAGFVGIIMLGGFPTMGYVAGHYPADRIMTYAFTALALFILMGQLTFGSGVASDTYILANKWLGGIRGGLVVVTIGACGLTAAATGSSVAEVAALARIVLPEMKKYGYDEKLATGTLASAGTVGILIPPSASLILYGILTQVSIGSLFIAGIFPGILSVGIYMAMVYMRCLKNPKLAPLSGVRVSWKERLTSLGNGWGVMLLFVVVIGGLYTGIATPTEVGALGCLIALMMTFLAIFRGKANWDVLKRAIVDTVKLQAMIFAFIIGSGLFSLMVTMTGTLPALVELVSGLQVPPVVIVAMLAVVYLPLGMFLDPVSMLIVTLPFTYPLVVSGLGFNGIWFGIILVKLIEVAMLTPPNGIHLYVIKAQFPEYQLRDIFQGCLWFMAMDLLTIAILIAFPQISLWLPSTMWG